MTVAVAVVGVVKNNAGWAGPFPLLHHESRPAVGFAKSTALACKSLSRIVEQTGHQDTRGATGYVREADLHRDPPGRAIGL